MSGWLDTLAALWAGVGAHLWQASWFLLLAAGLGLALRRAPARAANVVWWTAMAKLLLPVALLAPLVRVPLGWVPAGWADPTARAPLVEQVFVWLGGPAWAAEPGTPATAWWPLALTVSWLAGASVLGWSWRRRRPRAAEPGVPLDRVAAPLRERVAAAIGRSGIPLAAIRVADAGMVPCVRGAWRPRIVLSPALIRGLDAAELRAVLLHEDAHRRRRDPLLALVQRVALTLFFFYPPLWWLVRRLRDSAEQACDESAVARGVEPACYARALARVVRLELDPVAAPAVLGLGAPSRLAHRLERIRDSRRYAMQQRHRLSLAAAVVALAAVSLLPAVVSAGNDSDPRPTATGATEALAGAHALRDIPGIDAPFTFDGERIELDVLLDAFRAATGFDARFDARFDEPLTLRAQRGVATTLRVALLDLASQNGVTYRVDGSTLTLLPRPRLAGTDGVSNPRVVIASKVNPVYPEQARVAGVEGLVVLQAVIRADGSVGETEVLREEPRDYGFGESARAAVARWRYEPALYKDRPVDVYFTVVIHYALGDKDEDDDQKDKDDGPTLATLR
jgi:TonB family protein